MKKLSILLLTVCFLPKIILALGAAEQSALQALLGSEISAIKELETQCDAQKTLLKEAIAPYTVLNSKGKRVLIPGIVIPQATLLHIGTIEDNLREIANKLDAASAQIVNHFMPPTVAPDAEMPPTVSGDEDRMPPTMSVTRPGVADDQQ